MLMSAKESREKTKCVLESRFKDIKEQARDFCDNLIADKIAAAVSVGNTEINCVIRNIPEQVMQVAIKRLCDAGYVVAYTSDGYYGHFLTVHW